MTFEVQCKTATEVNRERYFVIKQMTENGHSTAEIAERLRVTPRRAYQLIHENGFVPLRQRGKTHQRQECARKAWLVNTLRHTKMMDEDSVQAVVASIELPTHCPMLNTELVYGGRGFMPESASIDRIDNKKGYVYGNIQVLSRRANTIKNNLMKDEYKAVSDYFAKLCELQS